MLSSKNLIGRRGSVFTSSKKFTSASKVELRETFTLQNSKSVFVFKKHPIYGPYLYSFKSKLNGTTFYNKSKCLWKLGIKRVSYIDSSSRVSFSDNIVIHPRAKYYSQTDSTESGNTLVFVWKDVPYDSNFPAKTCKITVTVELPHTEAYLDISVRVTSTPGVSSALLTQGAVLHAVCFPEIIIDKDTDTQDQDVLVLGTLMGDCTRDPIKHLNSPRFTQESTNYSDVTLDGGATYKFYKGGQPGSPSYNQKILNFGSPGWMSVPLMVWGNRTAKAGFLFHAVDSDGAHAKNFQAFSDGNSIHLRVWDISDEEVTPYGVGGLYSSSQSYNTDNNIGWTLRIRPFGSTTKWVDWYGPRLYKEETVEELEALGWIPKSFYQRYVDGELSAEEVEVPFYSDAIGHLSGTADDAHACLGWYRDLYTGISNQGVAPIFYQHVQEVNLNAQPLASQSAQYFGWVQWATGESGISSYKVPNYTLNSTFSGAVGRANISGVVDMLYLPQMFRITTGSDLYAETQSVDISVKTIEESKKTFSLSDFNTWTSNFTGGRSVANDPSFISCYGIDPTYNVKTGVARYLASHGAGIYHDTMGLWGSRGCYAETHVYKNPAGVTVTGRHPKGQFTHFFNERQMITASGMTAQMRSGSSSNLTVGVAKHSFAQSAEHLCDAQLKYVPMSIPLGSAYSNTDLSVYIRDRSTLRSDFLFELDFVSFIVGIRRKPSNKLAVPVFSIVYGDRSILGNWAAPTLSNLLDLSGLYINYQEITGYSSSNVALARSPTHQERIQQLQNIAAVDFSRLGHLTIYHQSLDYLDYNLTTLRTSPGSNSTFSSALVTENHQDILTGTRWSGYLGYCKELIRAQAYEPDYMYHGTIDHLFDTYSTPWSSGVYTVYSVQGNNTSFSEPSGTLDEGVVHHVRKHHSSSSRLACMTNWTNSTQYFTGIFDPLTYDISSAYRVYQLNVSEISPGTKTLITTVPARQSYTLDLTMSPSSSKVYEFVPELHIRDILATGQYLYSDYTPIRYSYTSRAIMTDSIGIAYSYESQCGNDITDPMVGFRSPSTQAIVNNLPQWMKMRQDIDSDGWKLVNSWGMSLEHVIETVEKKALNMALETADKLVTSKIGYVDLEDKFNYKLNNVLFNSSFSLRDTSRSQLPAGWTNYGKGTVEITTDKSSIIGNTVKLYAGVLSQSILVNSTIDQLTASVYILAPDPSPSVRLVITAEDIDGIVYNSEARLESRSREWRRLVLTTPINKEIYRVQITIASSGSATYVCAPKLEQGDHATIWTRSIIDKPSWISSFLSRINLAQVVFTNEVNNKVPLIPVGDQDEFLEQNVPTRIEKIYNRYTDVDTEIAQDFGRKVSFFNEVHPVRWYVEDGIIKEGSLLPSLYDVYGEYSLSELRYGENLVLGTINSCSTNITPINCAVRDQILYVLCTEETDGETIYTLKICEPRTPPNGESYLECFYDYKIDIELNNVVTDSQIEETITSVGFSRDDDKLFVVNTNIGRQLTYRLRFDYYYFDSTKNRLYLLEDYTNCRIQVL